jgi:hypothetical protein
LISTPYFARWMEKFLADAGQEFEVREAPLGLFLNFIHLVIDEEWGYLAGTDQEYQSLQHIAAKMARRAKGEWDTLAASQE